MIDFYNRPMQEFGTQTLASGYIQNLIASTPLPICDTVRRGDFVVKGISYIYNFNLIEVTKTGFLDIQSVPPLYPSDTLYPSDALFPTDGAERATYTVLSQYRFGRSYPKLTYTHKPNNVFYDSETHRHLGKYLRCLRDMYDVNYMPFYNCYTAQNLPNISSHYTWKYIYIVPVKFNTMYTMSWESNFAVVLQPTIYTTHPVTFENYLSDATQREQLQHEWKIASAQKVVQGRKYSDLYKFRIQTSNPIIYRHQKYLYMLVLADQPITSLAVIEGNYTDTNNISLGTHDEAYNMDKYSPAIRDSADIGVFEVTSKLKLLSSEGRNKSYAFSNRLLEGLLHHTINSQDDISQNIARVQKVMGFKDDGIWADEIKTHAFRDYLANAKDLTQYDITGNIDKDVEYFYFGNNISAQ